MKTIAIYWNNDSNELRDLPDVRVATCGNDGMEVVGGDDAITALYEAVVANPAKFTLAAAPCEATESDLQNAVEFSRGNWPEFDTIEDVTDWLST